MLIRKEYVEQTAGLEPSLYALEARGPASRPSLLSYYFQSPNC